MSSRRLGFLILGIFLIIALLVLGVLIAQKEMAAATERLEGWLADNLGMQVRGQTKIELLPYIGFSFSEVVILEGKTPLFSARKVAVGVELLPLLRRKVRVAEVHLEEPMLAVRRDKNGTYNLEKAWRPGWAKISARTLSVSGTVTHGTLLITDEINGAQWKFEELDLEFEDLRPGPKEQLSFTGRLHTERLRVNAIEMLDVSGMLIAKGGVYLVEPLRFTLFGGGGKGRISADMNGAQPFYRAELSADNFSLASLYQNIAGKVLLEGAVSFQAELSAHGPGRIVNGLTGSVKIAGSNIFMYGFDLDGFIADFRKSRKVDLVDIGSYLLAGPVGVLIKESYELNDMYANLNQEKRETLEKIVFNWTIEKGIARTEDVAFRTNENRVAIQGSLDLARSHYAGITLGLLDHQGCAEITEEITGPLSNPTVKMTGLMRFLAGPLLAVLSKVLEIFEPEECKPFYTGQVPHPQ